MMFPALLQLLQITKINKAAELGTYKYLRQLKMVALLGAGAACMYEKYYLEKKWMYYDRFYPEPTQLQRSLVQEAHMFADRESRGVVEQTLEERSVLDPETAKIYESMYQLAPQTFAEPEADVNPASIQSHYGSS